MVQINQVITILIWTAQALFGVLLTSYWLQVKEYRFDRFVSFAKTGEGRKELSLHFNLLKLATVFLSLYYIEFFIVSIGFFIIADLIFFRQLIKRKLRRPVFTTRGKRIVGTALILVLVVGYLFMVTDYGMLNIFFGEIIILIGPVLGVVWTQPIVNRVRRKEIAQAKEKLNKIKPIVVGITGSYGKTTTKDFVAQILSSKYKVEKTYKNENTDFGIARKIINNLDTKTEVFVVEMGAYRKGDISKLADMVNPSYGIITGIEQQHLDLFGSLENIKEAKYELIASLKKGAVALINLSNSESVSLYRKAIKNKKDIKVFGYLLKKEGLDENSNITPDLEARIIKSDIDGVTFEITDNMNKKKLFAPVKGVHFIENITGAILLARQMGVGWREIEKALVDIKTPDKTMKVFKLTSGATIIDDTYNATPKAFEAALNYLSYFTNNKKIVVTRGVSELGPDSLTVHKNIGSFARGKVDVVIVSNSEVAGFIEEGIENAGSPEVVAVNDVENIIKLVRKYLDQNAVVLFEGKIHSQLTNYLEEVKKEMI